MLKQEVIKPFRTSITGIDGAGKDTISKEVVVRASTDFERLVSSQDPAPDIVLSSRDPRLDPAVYFSYYAPGMSQSVDVSERLKTVQKLTAAQRDLIILLKIDPRAAVDRIDSRIEAEALERLASGNQSAGLRDKWRHIHENVDDLGMLGRGYEVALEALHEVNPTRVIEIDTTDKPKDLVADIAYYAILQSMSDNIAVGERFELQQAA